MAKKDFPHINYIDLLNNYEFKVASRILKQEFPYITRVYMRNPDEINDYSLIFLDVDMDPDKLFEFYNEEPASYLKGYKERKEVFHAPSLRVAFKGRDFDLKDPNETLIKIGDSNAIPHHLKIPRPRKLRIGSYYIPYDKM